jgi:SAM-dependent methyltransferase
MNSGRWGKSLVSDWTEGYVADIDYTYGYYEELNPQRLLVPFLNVGLLPPEIVTACELGYGQGVSVNLHAAASPARWYGTDFNPAHAGFAQSLVRVAGSGTELADQSFAEFCNRGDLPEFDFIGLHGIYSWVSAENQAVIVDFVRRKLKPGGVLYLGYNAQPGYAATAPLQHLFARHAEVMEVPGRGVLARLDGALHFADKLLALNPLFALANPPVNDRLRQIKGQDRQYLAHEYLNRYWRPLWFAELAEQLVPAKMSFACSAIYLDHVNTLNLTAEQQGLLSEIADPVFRQSMRDFVINQQFRRDYWVKGPRRVAQLDLAAMIRGLRAMLMTPRGEVALTVTGSLGQREMAPHIYGAVLDALADGDAKAVGDIEQAVRPAGLGLGTVYEALTVLAGKGDLAIVQDDAAQTHVKARTDRLNLYLLERARGGGDVNYLASPVTGGGVAAGRFHQLFLLGLRRGRQGADDLAGFAWEILSAQSQRVVKDNKPLDSDADNLAELAAQAREFIDQRLPALRKLQIA